MGTCYNWQSESKPLDTDPLLHHLGKYSNQALAYFVLFVFKGSNMQLFIKGLQTSVLEVSDNESILSVKERLANSDGIPVEDQVLSFAGRPLDDDQTLMAYGVAELSTLSVDVRMLGGQFPSSISSLAI